MSLSFNEDPVFLKVKQALIKRGCLNGLKAVVTTFRSFDLNKDNLIDPQEWYDGLHKFGVRLTQKDANYLFSAFEKDNSGYISVDTFISQLVGQMNKRRSYVVRKAFESLDADCDGKVSIEDIKRYFSHGHDAPLVKSGTLTAKKISCDFLDCFDESRHSSGSVSLEEYQAYYAVISSGVGFDDFFETMVLRDWGIDNPEHPMMASTVRSWEHTTNGSDPLEIKGPLLQNSNKRWHLSHTGRTRNYDSTHMRRVFPPQIPNSSILPDYISITKKDYRPYSEAEFDRVEPLIGNLAEKPHVGSAGYASLDAIRKEVLVKAPPGEGFSILSRAFASLGVKREQVIQKEDLRSAFNIARCELTPVQLDCLFTFLSRNAGAEGLNMKSLMNQLRPPICDPDRLAILRVAFETLDTSHCGQIEFSEIEKYQDSTSSHPFVSCGAERGNKAVANLLSIFENWSESSISWEDWVEYYSDISAAISDTHQFELLVRETWHILGGVGTADKSTAMKILCRMRDGREQLADLKNNTGLNIDDKDTLKEALVSEGLKHVEEVITVL